VYFRAGTGRLPPQEFLVYVCGDAMRFSLLSCKQLAGKLMSGLIFGLPSVAPLSTRFRPARTRCRIIVVVSIGRGISCAAFEFGKRAGDLKQSERCQLLGLSSPEDCLVKH